VKFRCANEPRFHGGFAADRESFDIRKVSALEVLRNRALQIDICLHTYLLEQLVVRDEVKDYVMT